MTKREEITEKAKKADAKRQAALNSPIFIRAMQWLGFTGLLRHNQILPKKITANIEDMLVAAELEPRVKELLPAVLNHFSAELKADNRKLPDNLLEVINAYNANGKLPPFDEIPARKYSQWFDAPIIAHAKRKLKPRNQPRLSHKDSSNLGQMIKNERIRRGFTQLHFANEFEISLRALRDLEQGKYSVTVYNLMSIMAPLELNFAFKS